MYVHRIALSVILPPRPTLELTEAISPFHAATSPVSEVGPVGVDYTDSIASDVNVAKLSARSSKSLMKQKTLGSVATSSPLMLRKRSSSLQLKGSSSLALGDAHTPAKVGIGRNERPSLVKQQTVELPSFSEKSISSGGSLPSERGARRGRERGRGRKREDVGGGVKSKPVQDWRGLKLDVLRSRVQRLSVLLELSEPGTIPDSGMLASLVDLVSDMR